MMRLPRWALVAMSSGALVVSSAGVVAAVSGAGASTTAPPSAVAGPSGDTHVASSAELTKSAAAGAKQASIELAAELATPQTIANMFYVTQSMAALKP